MIKYSMIIFYQGSPLVVLLLNSPSPNHYDIVDDYSKKYEFNRKDLNFSITEILEDKELTEF